MGSKSIIKPKEIPEQEPAGSQNELADLVGIRVRIPDPKLLWTDTAADKSRRVGNYMTIEYACGIMIMYEEAAGFLRESEDASLPIKHRERAHDNYINLALNLPHIPILQ